MPKKKGPSQKDFKILLTFLTEEDPATLTMVKSQIREVLKRHPRYKRIIESLSDVRLRHSARRMVEEFHLEEVEQGFQAAIEGKDDVDLEEALFWIAKIEKPAFTRAQLSKSLDALAEEAGRAITSEKPLPTRSIAGMRAAFFETLAFQGDEKDYYDVKNIYLESVLRRKKGIPISLCSIYLLVAWRLKLLVHGVGLPGHFIVGHRVPRGVVHIDPFRGGRILRVKDCEVLVRRLGIPFRQSYLDPVSNRQIVARTLVNLINIYSDQGNDLRAKWLAGLFQLLE